MQIAKEMFLMGVFSGVLLVGTSLFAMDEKEFAAVYDAEEHIHGSSEDEEVLMYACTVDIESLLLAIQQRDVVTGSAILNRAQNKIDLNAPAGDNGNTALVSAIACDSYAFVSALLYHKADPNTPTNHGFLPLTVAAQEGHGEIVTLLLKAKAQIDKRTNEENPGDALMFAASAGHGAVVKQLIDHNAEVDARYSHNDTPLTIAAGLGQVQAVRVLIAQKASVDLVQDRGVSALMIAANQGHTDVIKELIAGKADFNAQDSQGMTALMYASIKGLPHVAQELLMYKAAPDVRCKNGLTALLSAAYHGDTPEYVAVVQYLCEAKATVDLADLHGQTPLGIAAMRRHLNVAKVLQDAGAKEWWAW